MAGTTCWHCEKKIGLCGRGQLPGPCRLASGLPCDPVEQKDVGAVFGGSIAEVYLPGVTGVLLLNLREKPGTPDSK